ncbi:MAG: aminopeptidase [Bacteroidaceae bacterium]|nr:aminopeptidase [Bacteroidaceae bacterium]
MKKWGWIWVLWLLVVACTGHQKEVPVENGVSLSLAEQRTEDLSDVAYNLKFTIPSDMHEPVLGHVEISFNWKGNCPLQIDFQGLVDGTSVVNGKAVQLVYENEHIIIPTSLLIKGNNYIGIDIVSNDKSLNRNDDYLYTLFVPDHARSVFPCFDQPDIKARFTLELDIPKDWVAVSAGEIQNQEVDTYIKQLKFHESDLIPTYLFSFVAGKFEVEGATRNGRTVYAYYRETDPKKVAQLPIIFDQVFQSLAWLDDYTDIAFPFQKYDFIILPGFQFGGMEHVGAIQYNDKRMFVSEHPTPDEELSRMELIAHETSHMWFGDLVTMRWFNDVWTKEVFANYMAAKISHSHFKDINHDLNFIKDYHITALAEDRTEGTHPIQQPLDNLQNAGLVYGNIIYDKAPVMMRKLEEQMGSQAFQNGLQKYLRRFSYANATWDDLIAILDHENPDAHLPQFSEAWVKQKGAPVITSKLDGHTMTIQQKDPYDRGVVWQQRFSMGLIQEDGNILSQELNLQTSEIELRVPAGTIDLIPNYDGKGYARFDYFSMKWQLNHWYEVAEETSRLAIAMNIYEAYLMHQVDVEIAFQSLLDGLRRESNALIASSLCGYINTCAEEMQGQNRADAEQQLWKLSQIHSLPSCRQRLTRMLFSLATLPEVTSYVYNRWKLQDDALLNVNDYMTMAYQLALRMPDQWQQIVDEQRSRLTNADLMREFDFISRACNPDESVQQALFDSLLEPENRAIEPWVQRLLSLLNSPLREPANNRFILPGLEELQEVQQTGDIFFPKNWVASLLGGHHSQEAAQLVQQFLDEHPDYPLALKNKLLMAAYPLLNQFKE